MAVEGGVRGCVGVGAWAGDVGGEVRREGEAEEVEPRGRERDAEGERRCANSEKDHEAYLRSHRRFIIQRGHENTGS